MLYIIQHMPQFFLLCFEVYNIFFMWLCLYGNSFNNFKTIPLKSYNLLWIVSHKFHFSNSKVNEYLCTHTIVPEVRLKAQLDVSLNSVKTLILQFIRLKLVY